MKAAKSTEPLGYGFCYFLFLCGLFGFGFVKVLVDLQFVGRNEDYSSVPGGSPLLNVFFPTKNWLINITI